MNVHAETLSFRGRSALTGETIGPDYPISKPEDVTAACEAAETAFDAYRAASLEARADFLGAIGQEILELGDELIERAAVETGLPVPRLTGERARTVNQLRLFADVVSAGRWLELRIDPAQPGRQPLPRPDLRMRMVPLGPVAVFGASNFPLAFSTAGGDTASALAAGCPVIVKGHPAHPGTDAMVAGAILRAVNRCGMPAGTFGHVQGPGNELGATLVQDNRIAAVGFTGSRRGGLALMRLAQERPVPIPVYAEMSSINPVVLMPGALQARGAELGKAFAASLTMGAGQFCTNPGLIIAVRSSGLEQFEAAAAAAICEHSPQPMLTAGIRSAFADGVAALTSKSTVTELAAGLEGDGITREMAHLFATDAEGFLSDPTLSEEVFGASSLIVRCADLEQVKEVLRRLEGQLTATLHLDSEDERDAAFLVPILERHAGRVLVNGWPTGVEVSHAMVHGGPFPATSDGKSTSVGTLAITRFLRPVCYQDMPQDLLPSELRDGSTLPRLLDGQPK